MRVEVLEYGDEPETNFPEDFNSFKVMTVWSEPEVESEDHLPANLEIYESPQESPVEPKRLVTVVEFAVHRGGYFFIETPNPNPEWLEKVFEILKDEGWQGHGFNEIRGNCRGEIDVETTDDYTAVIDHEKRKVYHNRGKSKGNGEKINLNSWGNTKKC